MRYLQQSQSELSIDFWLPDVKRAWEALTMFKKYGPLVSWPIRSDLRVYGSCLAQARQRQERTDGILNQARQAAAVQYFSALDSESAIINEIAQSTSRDGCWSSPYQSHEERLEEASSIADKALLRWCAE